MDFHGQEEQRVVTMTTSVNTSGSASFSLAAKVKDYFLLTKFTLSFMVVFTCVISYLLAPNIVSYDWFMIIVLFIAGMLVTGSANAINQAVEKDTDAMMKRTASRPVASGRMRQQEAYVFAFIIGALGVFMMGWFFRPDENGFNWNAALLSAFSLFLYAFIYTPLKKINSIAVLVGAFPGALPCLIGWVAATNMLNPFGTVIANGKEFSNAGGWILFAIQFLWQFPHFWAIAWVAHSDYSKAGFKLLPAEKGPTRFTAVQGIMYSVLMIPVGILPYYAGMSGQLSMWILVAANLFMVIQSLRLYKEMNAKAARRVMFSSYIYLPIVFLALLADKVH